MRAFVITVKPIILIAIVLLFNVNPGCKDPHDFEPPEDSLVPPPDPPEHIGPQNNFVFMTEGTPMEVVIDFEWTDLEDANYYELEITGESYPPVTVYLDSNSWTWYVRDTHRVRPHSWRVHASGPHWTWFTEWSEPWYFEIRYRPQGPQQISPPAESTVYLDTLPNVVALYWHRISDETFYQVHVYKDTMLLYQDIVYDTVYWAYVDETVQYSWQVCAGSSMWQYYSHWSPLWNFWVALTMF